MCRCSSQSSYFLLAFSQPGALQLALLSHLSLQDCANLAAVSKQLQYCLTEKLRSLNSLDLNLTMGYHAVHRHKSIFDSFEHAAVNLSSLTSLALKLDSDIYATAAFRYVPVKVLVSFCTQLPWLVRCGHHPHCGRCVLCITVSQPGLGCCHGMSWTYHSMPATAPVTDFGWQYAPRYFHGQPAAWHRGVHLWPILSQWLYLRTYDTLHVSLLL